MSSQQLRSANKPVESYLKVRNIYQRWCFIMLFKYVAYLWFHGMSLNLLILKLTDAISEPGQSHQRTDCSNKMDKWFLGSSFSANIYWSANIIHCSNDFVTNFVKLLFFCVVPAIRSTNLFWDIFRHWKKVAWITIC